MIKKIINLNLIFLAVSLLINTSSYSEPSKDADWSKAGKEIVEAAQAIGSATKESTKEIIKKSKENSVDAWGKAKQDPRIAETENFAQGLWSDLKSALESAKTKIHKATAPNGEDKN